MAFEVIMVFVLIVAAMVLFATDSVPFDLVAMILMTTLMLTGVLTVKEGLSGFSNPATVTIAAMFALSRGIQNTGALRLVSRGLGNIARFSQSNATLIIMAIIGFVSAFINNTAAVIIFIPVLMATAQRMSVSPSRLLMPLSFASMFGGVCTLLGTSTNILVSSIAVDNGLAPFGMFEFTPFGLIILCAGFAYMYFVGTKLVPPRREPEDLTHDFKTVDYLTDVVVRSDFDHIGEPLREAEKRWQLDIDVLFVYRDGKALEDMWLENLRQGDVFRIRGNAKEIDKLVQKRPGLEVRPSLDWQDVDVSKSDYELIEAVVSPDSDYDGPRVRELAFDEKYGAIILGAYKRGHPERESLRDIKLHGGDSLLMALKENRVPELKRDDNFVVVSDVPVERHQTRKLPLALSILAGVVLSAALGLVPIVVSACAGVVMMVLVGCLRAADVHKAVNWKVIFLLGGVIPLGVAMQKSGAARLLSDLIVQTLGPLGPQAVLSGYFLLTTLLTAMISNQATAAILASLAIETAGEMGVAARPLLMAVTIAASLSLITPWGYQTNTLIYGPGRFRFTDYTKVGAPLNLIFWILGTIFIPVFWPF